MITFIHPESIQNVVAQISSLLSYETPPQYARAFQFSTDLTPAMFRYRLRACDGDISGIVYIITQPTAAEEDRIKAVFDLSVHLSVPMLVISNMPYTGTSESCQWLRALIDNVEPINYRSNFLLNFGALTLPKAVDQLTFLLTTGWFGRYEIDPDGTQPKVIPTYVSR